MREPWFWRSRSLAARTMAAALAPASLAYQAAHQLRWRFTKPVRASVPVICIGNATLGGTGKTPFAIMIARMLREEGAAPVFLTRGFGGALAGPVQVDPDRHSADDVGDEALLLVRHGPVIVSRDRPKGAALAEKAGATVIIMDDGFQNPSLHKDLSILLIGADEQASNGALFPAGPYRETLRGASARAGIKVSMTKASGGADFNAWLEPENAPSPEKVIAFAGIGRPEKFFASLEAEGFELLRRIAFPDHHRFKAAELRVLATTAAAQNARLITTEKDFVRLPANFRSQVLTFPVIMRVSDPDRLKRALMSVINKPLLSGARDHG